ncbi:MULTISPECIES: divalent-cation tolerance protein CutA [Aliarcobacter]|uniref:CutA divalent ion tolerance protein n=1 Tax=Aliarcobacter skirrowii CCUG 10374 TaxID=1032239 RepID=A0AAD0SJZ8_9BACT|nr:divalent-cation tolerance protein CutA [Aliarcobacter skirrowii]AXX84020.1 putative CutA divalent ion tolerance protein [Aliarcobacter skirrowii CCUG 10374]KAB0621791.1 divalent-cation tolerance protein CutA [Aliarcobacter skirrowii CCUG 10374]MDD2507677.1 divalent-cation tolerance protein CutA [Aliarcobacter skirrowii]MDD3496029.1 divalent-cation tolerance protein CutA [Aliarcobacter skirrowii]RXI27044.1 divalent-cation tolerance protein CutA [Aliarcobacter skirrowii CCUG 10374]
MNITIVKTTCKDKKEAENISKSLIKDKLAACVQMQKIKSIYFWNNKLCEDKEILLSIKTKKSLFSQVKDRILELHSYEVPQIIELEITNISENYKKFIEKNTF